MSLGPMRAKTPTAGLEILTDTMPLDLRIRGAGLKSFQRFFHHFVTAKWDRISECGTISLFKYWSNTARDNGLSLDREDISFAFNWKPPITYANVSDIAFQEKLTVEVGIQDKHPNGYIKASSTESTLWTRCVSSPGATKTQFVHTLLTMACQLLLAGETNVTKVLFKLPCSLKDALSPVLKSKSAISCINSLSALKGKGLSLTYVKWKPPWDLAFPEPESTVIPRAKGSFAAKVDI